MEDIFEKAVRLQQEAIAQRQKYEKEQKLAQFYKRQSESNMGKRNYNACFKKLEITKENKDIISDLLSYVKIPFEDQDKGYFIFGDCGTGKTYIIAALLNELMWMKRRNAIMATFIEIGNEIRSSYNKKTITPDDVIWKYSTVPYLAIDDLGTERFESNGAENWIQEQIFTIVNNRYKNEKPTFYTSNFSLEELSKRGLSNKIIDRIWHDSRKVFELKGKNYRV